MPYGGSDLEEPFRRENKNKEKRLSKGHRKNDLLKLTCHIILEVILRQRKVEKIHR